MMEHGGKMDASVGKEGFYIEDPEPIDVSEEVMEGAMDIASCNTASKEELQKLLNS